MKEILKFDLIPPNTILATEGQTDVPICYAIISGEVMVLKKDPKINITHDDSLEGEEHTKFNKHRFGSCKHEKVTD